MKRKLIIGAASTAAAAGSFYGFAVYGTALVAVPVARLRLANDRRRFRAIQRKRLRLAKREIRLNERIMRNWNPSVEDIEEVKRIITQATEAAEPAPRDVLLRQSVNDLIDRGKLSPDVMSSMSSPILDLSMQQGVAGYMAGSRLDDIIGTADPVATRPLVDEPSAGVRRV